jgi:hypothetical protein
MRARARRLFRYGLSKPEHPSSRNAADTHKKYPAAKQGSVPQLGIAQRPEPKTAIIGDRAGNRAANPNNPQQRSNRKDARALTVAGAVSRKANPVETALSGPPLNGKSRMTRPLNAGM